MSKKVHYLSSLVLMMVRSKGVCMQINNVVNSQIVPKKQNFKGSSANSGAFSNFSTYQSVPSGVSKAYASPRITQGYKELETFDVPYVGQGKLYELANGHKIAIVQKPGPFVINTCIKAGHEQESVTGHFLEHLVYNAENEIGGTTFASFLREIGADRDASVESFHTNYAIKYPFNDSENIDKIIKTQAKLLQEPKEFKNRFETEKGILVSEYTMRPKEKKHYDEATLRYTILNKLFGIDEKQKLEINEIEKVKNTQIKDVEDFYKNYYKNNNMATFIVGDVNPDEIVKIFTKYFDKQNNPSLKNEKQDLARPIQQTKRFDIKLNSEIDDNIKVGFIGPENNDIKGNFLNMALKLYLNDVKNNKDYLYEGMSTENEPVKNSIIMFSTKAKNGEEEQKLKDLYQNIFNLVQKPIPDKDLEILKIKLKESFTTFYESAYPIAILGGEKLLYSNKIDFFEYSKLVDKLTKEDLQNFAKKHFDLNKAVVIVTHESEDTKKASQTAFTGSKTTLDTSNMVEYKYPNNLQLIVDTSPSIAKTSFRLDFVSDEIAKTKLGVSKVFAFMLLKSLEDYKSEYPYISEPRLNVKLNKIGMLTTCPSEYTKKTIALVKANVLNPNLSQKALDETKELLKKEYEIISDEFIKKMEQQHYSNYNYRDSFAGYPSSEEACKNIDAITLSDVITFHKQIISSAQGRAILVMPKDTFVKQQSEILSLIGADISQLKPKQKNNLASKIPVQSISISKIIVNEIKGNNATIQQDFQISQNGDLKDELGVKLISIMLGEQSDSRLEGDIREKQGLSYTTGSLYDSDGRLGYLSLISNLPLDKNNANDLQKVLDTFKKNINDLINNPVSSGELERAKTTFKSQIIQDLEYSGGRNDLINTYGVDNVKNLYQLLYGITPDDINTLSKTFLTKPCIISINANKDVIDANKQYLLQIGEIV